jgi:hypothetical protein
MDVQLDREVEHHATPIAEQERARLELVALEVDGGGVGVDGEFRVQGFSVRFRLWGLALAHDIERLSGD